MTGASGNIIGICCKNVTRKNSGLPAADSTRTFVDVSETDVTKLIRHTDASLKSTVEYIDSCKNRMTSGKFKDVQKALGVNYEPLGILWCAALMRWFLPISCLMYDWMHIMMVHGVYNLEVGLLLKVMYRMQNPLRFTDINNFFAQFTWPWYAKKQGKTVFRKRADDAEGKPKPTPLQCSASEALGSFMLLLMFLQVNNLAGCGDAAVVAAVESYRLMCTVISMLIGINRGFHVGVNDLAHAIAQYLEAHKRSYGKRWWIPKMHYLLHIPFMLLAHGILIACFVHERKHKEIKRYAQQRLSQSDTFERNILVDLLHYQLKMLQEPTTFGVDSAKLVKPRDAKPAVTSYVREAFTLSSTAQVKTSLLAHCPRFMCHVQDVVQIRLPTGHAVGQVVMHAAFDDVCWTCVQTWTKLPLHNMYSTKGETMFVQSHDIESAFIYKISGDVAMVVPSFTRDPDVCV